MDTRMRKFWIMAAGQFMSTLGSSMSGFALSIWVLTRTKSVTVFSFTFAATILAKVLFAPFAGSIADRQNRKGIIIICDTIDAVLKVLMLTIFYLGNFEIWMIVFFNFLSSTLETFQSPAFSASRPVLVPKDKLPRVNNIMATLYSVKMLIAPVVTGMLYPILGVIGIFIIDFISYGFAILTVLPGNFDYERIEVSKLGFISTVYQDSKETFIYMKKMGAFIHIVIGAICLNYFAITTSTLIGPLIMQNYGSKEFGIIQGCFGAGMMVGGIIFSTFPIKEKRVRAIFSGILITGIGQIIMGLNTNWLVIGFGYLVFSFPFAMTNGSFGTLIQLKVPINRLGKFGALLGAMLMGASPIAILLSGILADYVFKPIFHEKGLSYMFIICGVTLILICIRMLMNKEVMSFEEDYPDAINE